MVISFLGFDVDVIQLQHPSALDMFEQIIEASQAKQIVMFLDYDGTLSPIVEDPDRAFMSDSVSTLFLALFTVISLFPPICVSKLNVKIPDEKDGQKTCWVFSNCNSEWKMQRQGTFFSSCCSPFYVAFNIFT